MNKSKVYIPVEEKIKIEDWSIPVDGTINVPDELDALINKMAFQVKLHTVSQRISEAEMICRMAFIAQKFFTEKLQPVERYVLEEEDMINLLDKYKSTLLKEISETFLKSSNQVMADRETDRHVFQAIGETIENFPFDSTLFLNPQSPTTNGSIYT